MDENGSVIIQDHYVFINLCLWQDLPKCHYQTLPSVLSTRDRILSIGFPQYTFHNLFVSYKTRVEEVILSLPEYHLPSKLNLDFSKLSP